MKRSVLSPDETVRRELKIRRTSECFWWTSRCFICWWITLSNAWYYFTIKMILERKNEQFFICFLNSHKTFNPFAPEPPKIALRIHVLSTACNNVMSFNDQGQRRYYRSCARWRKLSNHTWAQWAQWTENFHENLVPLPTYLSINLILSLKLLYKLFPPKWSLLNA